MCITLALAAISTAVGVAGAVEQANARQEQADYNAQVARNNAITAEHNAQDVEDRGARAQSDLRTRVRQTMGSARSALSGNGLLMDGGPDTTSGQLMTDLAMAGHMDVLTLTENVDREARRARVQGSNFTAQAGLFDLQSSSISPTLSGVTAGIGGLAQNSDILFPA